MPGNAEKQPESGKDRLYKKGLIAMESGQYDYAVSLFREALALDPHLAEAADGIKTAKMRKLRRSHPLGQKIKKPVYSFQGAVYKKLKKTDRALDKYENALALQDPSYKLLLPLADLYYEKGMTENASAAYKSVLQSDINNTHCLLKLGKIYIEQGNMPEAKKIFDHLASVSSLDDAVMKEVKDAYALLTIDRGRWEKDSSFREKLNKQDGENEIKHEPSEAAVTPEEKRKLGDKISALKKGMEKTPGSLSDLKLLADSLSRLRRFDEAAPLYRKILMEEPDNLDVLRAAGNIYIKSGEFEKAAKILEKLNSLLPENTNVLNVLAGVYVKQDAELKAIETYLKLADLQPADPNTHEAVGKLYEKNRYFHKAVEQYEKVIELQGDRTDLIRHTGDLYLRDAKKDLAIVQYQKAASSDPGNISIKKTLAGLHTEEKRFEEAAAVLKEILKLRPDDPETKEKLQKTELRLKENLLLEAASEIKKLQKTITENPADSGLREKIKKAEQAEADLRADIILCNLKSHPENAGLRFELGLLYRNRGELDFAIKEFQQTARDPGNAVESLHMLGLCFEDKNILDMAGRQLEKAESMITETTELKKAILYDLGRVYEKMGENDKALDKYKQIYEVDISYGDVVKKIEQAYGQHP